MRTSLFTSSPWPHDVLQPDQAAPYVPPLEPLTSDKDAEFDKDDTLKVTVVKRKRNNKGMPSYTYFYKIEILLNF